MIYKENARNLVVLAGFFFVFWFFFLSCGFLNLKKNCLIHLAVSGLSCSVRDLRYIMWDVLLCRMGSLVKV